MLGRKGDLVIAHSFSFDFSWKSREDAVGGMVHPEAVHYAENDWLARVSKSANLRRVKAVHVPRQSMDNLLKKLESSDKLEQLEIETYAVHHRQKSDYRFVNLKLLSIDAIRLLDDKDKPVSDSNTNLKINAAQLKTVHLGSDTLSYLTFTHPLSIRSLTLDRDSKRKILTFKNLTTLRLNQVQFSNFMDISKLLQFRNLTELHCNTHRLDCTAYKPTEKELNHLESLHRQLEIRSLYPNLQVYFNSVPLTSDRLFSDYHFERNLVNVHYHNFVPGETALVPCESVTRLSYLDLLDNTFELNRRVEQELSRLFELYSNIRICVLDNSDGQRPVEPEPFTKFLSRCDALAELTICNSGFPATWYKGLDKLHALNSLVKFALSESIGFAGHVKFDFLAHFKHLLRFSTNLATQQVMVDLVHRMRVSATMGFQFWSPLEASHYDIIVQKPNEGELALYQRKTDPDGHTDIVLQKVMPFESAVEHLASDDCLFCGHWMEDLPPEPVET